MLAANTPKFAGVVPPDAEVLLEELIVFGTPGRGSRAAGPLVRGGSRAADRSSCGRTCPRERDASSRWTPCSARGREEGHGSERVTGVIAWSPPTRGGTRTACPPIPSPARSPAASTASRIEEYCTNPTKAVRAMLNYYERYQPDIMIAFNDLAKEAEAIGCRVKYSDYVVPSIDRHVLAGRQGLLARLEMPDPIRDGRLPAFLEQCAALSAAQLPSALGAVLVGPWTIAMLHAQPRADVPGHDRRSRLRPRAHALLHRVRQAVRRRRAHHEDRPELHGSHRLLLAGRPRHLSRVHQAVPQGDGGLLQGQEGRDHGAHLWHHPPDPRGPGRRRLRRHHHRPRPAGRPRAARSTSSTSW